MVGSDGELEHAAALLHPAMGAPLRKAVEKGAALVPSNKKMGTCGQSLDVPLGHKDAAYVRSHFDGMEVSITDAPRASEILVATPEGHYPESAGLRQQMLWAVTVCVNKHLSMVSEILIIFSATSVYLCGSSKSGMLL